MTNKNAHGEHRGAYTEKNKGEEEEFLAGVRLKPGSPTESTPRIARQDECKRRDALDAVPWIASSERVIGESATISFMYKMVADLIIIWGIDGEDLEIGNAFSKLESYQTKLKQGLQGFGNGREIAALADTGSRKNMISASYAEKLGLEITGSPSTFELGNSRKAQSTGIVSLKWAFEENPKKTTTIVCHVLPNCIYDLILGNSFLRATETLSKYRHRITKCCFSVLSNFAHFGYLGKENQRLQGTLADTYGVLAVPDTGAERNVMNLDYALEKGLDIQRNQQYREYLQFADGTTQETAGVLADCCSDVVIGEEFLSDHNVFEDHVLSIIDTPYNTNFYELATFDFIRRWQRPFEKLRHKLNPQQRGPEHSSGRNQTAEGQVDEQRRRDIWDYTYDFGAKANSGEKEVERLRRARYAAGQAGHDREHHEQNITSRQFVGSGALTSDRDAPMIPSIPTAPSRR